MVIILQVDGSAYPISIAIAIHIDIITIAGGRIAPLYAIVNISCGRVSIKYNKTNTSGLVYCAIPTECVVCECHSS